MLPTVISGLQTYFDRALGANLLYRFERPQFAEIRRRYVTGQAVIVGQEKDMSAVYGAEHFLRMLGVYSLALLSPSHLHSRFYSEHAINGCNVDYGSRERRNRSGLRE